MRSALIILCVFSGCTDGGSSSTASELLCDGTEPETLSHTPGASVDYLLECNLQITSTLTILPGTVIAFGSGGGMTTVDGVLNITGTAAEPVVLQAAKPGSPWQGLAFFGEAESLLEQVILTEAGATTVMGSASVTVGLESYNEGHVSIRDCVIDGGPGIGVVVGVGSLVDFTGNTITGKAQPLAINIDSLQDLSDQNELTGNTLDAIEIWPRLTSAEEEQLWPWMPIPYRISQGIDLPAPHALSAGVQVHLSDGGTLRAHRGLKAMGTEAEEISFQGEEGLPGEWNSIVLLGGTSTFSHVRFANGSGLDNSFDQAGMVTLDSNGGGELEIRDCVLEGSAGYGLWLGLPSYNDDIDTANVFANNALGDIFASQ